MAEVLEGVAIGQHGFRRKVAIKRILREYTADPGFGRMFFDEAKIASQLHHANIVAVLDFGVSDGVPFQVLEFVDGVDASRLRDLGEAAGHPFPIELALAIATDVAHALEHAHAAIDDKGARLGIVHRDVSPANVLVAWSGDVKLSDFGIAFAHGRNEPTHAGQAKGTLLYMAPEQVLRGEIDGRTDLFGLGCALHTLCTGKSPLSVENAMADLIAGGTLALDPSLPEDVRAIVARATRLSRSERWASATEMADALGSALAARVTRDARTLMREWLTLVKPGPAPKRRGKLDGFLDLELVLQHQEGGVREFNLRPTLELERIEILNHDKISPNAGVVADRHGENAAGTHAEDDADRGDGEDDRGDHDGDERDVSPGDLARATTRLAPSASPSSPSMSRTAGAAEHGSAIDPRALEAFAVPEGAFTPTRRRGPTRVALGIGVVALAVVGVVAVSSLSTGARQDVPASVEPPLAAPPDSQPTSAGAARMAAATTPTSAPSMAAPGNSQATTLPIVAGATPAIAIRPATPPVVRPIMHAPTPPATPVHPAPTAPAAPAPTPTPSADLATGDLAIGGAGALKAEIFVDGVSRGYAPKRLDARGRLAPGRPRARRWHAAHPLGDLDRDPHGERAAALGGAMRLSTVAIGAWLLGIVAVVAARPAVALADPDACVGSADTPEIMCAPPMTVLSSIIPTIPVTVTAVCGVTPTVVQDPPAGTEVAIGTTMVTITATDSAGQQVSCTTSVTMEGAVEGVSTGGGGMDCRIGPPGADSHGHDGPVLIVAVSIGIFLTGRRGSRTRRNRR